MAKDSLDELIFNSKIQSKSKSILDDLDELDDDFTLPSQLYSESKKKKTRKEETKDHTKDKKEDPVDDEWASTLTMFKTPKIKKGSTKRIFEDAFNKATKKDKKKNKNKDGQAISHKKNFEPELMMLRNIQRDQDKFVNSLQKKYDQMENTKSTARGIGKYTTDLILSINTARSLSMQVIDKIISTKKTIADLDFKERKEFGSNKNSEQTNLTNYASTYLNQMMKVGRNNVVNTTPEYNMNESVDNDDSIDDIFSSIDENLGATDRSEDVEKYLQYENDDVHIKVLWNDNVSDDDLDNKYHFIAINKYGQEVPDYPLPEKTRLNINRSTNVAVDKYGNKYKMEMI